MCLLPPVFPRETHLRQLLAEGRLGRIVLVRLCYWGWFNPAPDDPKHWRVEKHRSGGGPLADMGSHMLDQLIGLFGMPLTVSAKCETLAQNYEVEDSASIIMTLANGAHVTAHFGWQSKTWRHELEVVGTEGKVLWSPADTGKVQLTIGRDTQELDFPNAANVHQPLIDDFVAAIRDDRAPAIPVAQALLTNQLMRCRLSFSARAARSGGDLMQPENDFVRFYNIYYEECRRDVPQIAAIAAKWRFEDLIPGLSDFDARFMVEDGMSVADWCTMSTQVGAVHLKLCREYPHWARNLEHLPGINLTWSELTDAARYYPEYAQWMFYRTEDPARLATAEQYLQRRTWDEQDEYFHLKKFCLYHGRYNRQIDRPINLGPFVEKYPLHSRCLHYFVPALQSAVCLLLRRPIAGKLESLRLACELHPRPVLQEVRDLIDRHYETPALDGEPALTQSRRPAGAGVGMVAANDRAADYLGFKGDD